MTKPCATLLIVEDELDIRKFLRVSLAAEGYRVVESATARRGVTLMTLAPEQVPSGFIAALATRTSPVDIPPSVPPASADSRRYSPLAAPASPRLRPPSAPTQLPEAMP